MQRFQEEMLQTRLSKEQIEQLIRPAVLADLSLDEYIRVWRRIDPYWVSHVTRQGIRDHFGMANHSAGVLEYQDGLGGMLRNGCELRAPRMVHDGLDPTCERSIERFLQKYDIFKEPTLEKAQKLLRQLIHRSYSAPPYADKGAVHFAAQTVLDDLYGGESGNEVFVIYPSSLIASQYYYAFNGAHKDFTKPQDDRSWNDVFVWDKDNAQTAIPLNAGILFLPNSTRVDPVTGSRYALEKQEWDGKTFYTLARYPEFDERFAAWCDAIPTDSEFAKAILEQAAVREEMRQTLDPIKMRALFKKRDELLETLKQGIKKTLENLQTPEEIFDQMHEKLLKLAENIHMSTKLVQRVQSGQEQFSFSEETRKSRLYYLRPATNSIPAKQYWKQRFAAEPEFQLKHIVYYDGNPTEAVERFLMDHGISATGSSYNTRHHRRDSRSDEERLIGWSKNLVTDLRGDPRANQGLPRLEEIAHQLLKNHYIQNRGSENGVAGHG